ncbi:MAG: hypothetical protein KDB23_30095 [Planctomycetales bacterium]|nr:hypothetical protein [Planctomycetales bacterium]
MKHHRFLEAVVSTGVLSLATLLLVAGSANVVSAAKIMYLVGNEGALTEGNEVIFDLFDARGDEIELWGNNMLRDDPDTALLVADESDLVFIDESISSSRADVLIDTITPVINNEQYAFDNWGLTGLSVGHGSPNRPGANGPLEAGSSFGTDVSIALPNHPIAQLAGLSGTVSVYDTDGGRLDWGRPGGDADVVALLPGYEDYPASPLFVYEAGDTLWDGSTAAGMRIGMFLSDTNRGPEPDDTTIVDDAVDGSGPAREATLLTPAGLALLTATIDYALGLAPQGVVGDYDGSGALDVADANLLTQQIASGGADSKFDANKDGTVDSSDISSWIHDIKKTWIGDADLNGEFNSGDFVKVFTSGKFELDLDAVWEDGDWNGDGRFNSGDFVSAFQDGGYEQGLRAAVSAVPEPGCLGLGLLTLLPWARRRK